MSADGPGHNGQELGALAVLRAIENHDADALRALLGDVLVTARDDDVMTEAGDLLAAAFGLAKATLTIAAQEHGQTFAEALDGLTASLVAREARTDGGPA